jgi:hypothetical protein
MTEIYKKEHWIQVYLPQTFIKKNIQG